jgi:hypothetical protein
LVLHPGSELSSTIGSTDLARLARLAPGGGPGTWEIAWFLPLGAAISFGLVGKEYRGRAWRAALIAIAGTFLAWASSAGWMPDALANAPIYVVAAAVAEAALVSYGLATVTGKLGSEAFGMRQMAAVVMGAILFAGIGAQAMGAAFADWAIGPNREEPAWPVVASAPGDFRVLWIGRADGDPFPAPGGDPAGVAPAGDASVRWAITDKDGATALDMGRAEDGPGYDYTVRSLQEVASGGTRHAGALLSVLGVRFLVAGEGDLPASVHRRLDEQVDLDLVPAGGLVIYRVANPIPPAALIPSKPFARAARRSDLAVISRIPSVGPVPLPTVGAGWSVPQGASGFAYVADQFADGWVAKKGTASAPMDEVFGWAMGSPDAAGATITFEDQWIRTTEMWILALLWLAALWVTRKPVSR